MDIQLIQEGIAELLPMQGRSGDPRSHISVVVRDMCLRLGHFEERTSDSPSPQVLFELGNSFEDAVGTALAERWAKEHPDRYARPGQLERDGLFGTPDLLDIIECAVVEIKLTWMSAKHDPESEKFWKYWAQAKSYAAMMKWNVIYLHVCFINGNYRRDTGGPDPQYRIWRGTLTDKERELHWHMMRQHHAAMLRRG